jgi:putative membrane protein
MRKQASNMKLYARELADAAARSSGLATLEEAHMSPVKIFLSVILSTVGAVALAAGDKISADDFVKKASEAGMAEVAMGKLGADKAKDASVKAFAQRMVKDHTKANSELMAAAKTKGLKVSTEPGTMHKAMKEKFEHQSADTDFDHDFMEQMVKDHEKAVELFQTASSDTTLDADLRSLAKKTLPTLEEHLADARKLEAKMGGKEKLSNDQ